MTGHRSLTPRSTSGSRSPSAVGRVLLQAGVGGVSPVRRDQRQRLCRKRRHGIAGQPRRLDRGAVRLDEGESTRGPARRPRPGPAVADGIRRRRARRRRPRTRVRCSTRTGVTAGRAAAPARRQHRGAVRRRRSGRGPLQPCPRLHAESGHRVISRCRIFRAHQRPRLSTSARGPGSGRTAPGTLVVPDARAVIRTAPRR